MKNLIRSEIERQCSIGAGTCSMEPEGLLSVSAHLDIQTLERLPDQSFRRGVHAAVAAVVADLTDLVARRRAAHSPQQTTEVIVAMAKRIAERPYPTEDPGPSPEDPEVPAEPRPTTEMLLAVACLAAEESGLPVQITVTSDGVLVQGRNGGRSALRALSWQQITQSDVPMLSLAVEAVVEELRG